jgi:hypothetical protein
MRNALVAAQNRGGGKVMIHDLTGHLTECSIETVVDDAVLVTTKNGAIRLIPFTAIVYVEFYR